jgi:hypothetical protein
VFSVAQKQQALRRGQRLCRPFSPIVSAAPPGRTRADTQNGVGAGPALSAHSYLARITSPTSEGEQPLRVTVCGKHNLWIRSQRPRIGSHRPYRLQRKHRLVQSVLLERIMKVSALFDSLTGTWGDEILFWVVAAIAGFICLIALVNVLDLFLDNEADPPMKDPR